MWIRVLLALSRIHFTRAAHMSLNNITLVTPKLRFTAVSKASDTLACVKPPERPMVLRFSGTIALYHKIQLLDHDVA